jgi:hydroxymethylglutaryl-CoA lyase
MTGIATDTAAAVSSGVAARSVTVCESVLRDGLQGWPAIVATDAKVALVHAIAAAGFAELDVTSFVPASVVPQFGDALEVLAAVPDRLRTRVLTVNVKGVQRVVQAHQQVRRIDACGIPFSASEAHNIANLRRDHAAHRVAVGQMVEDLLTAGIQPLVGIATAFGCPITGRIDPDTVFDIASWLHSLGVRKIMLGDTTGMADPGRAECYLRFATQEWPDTDFVAHFHDNRGCGVANALAALRGGATTVDSSLGGLGGEPSSVDQGDVGESGNVATEDLAAVLDRLGYVTGLDIGRVLSVGALLEERLGRRLHSRVMRAGPVTDPASREGR